MVWRQRWLTGAPCRNSVPRTAHRLGPLDWQPGDHATDAYACRSGRIRRQTAAAGHFLGAIAIQTVWAARSNARSVGRRTQRVALRRRSLPPLT